MMVWKRRMFGDVSETEIERDLCLQGLDVEEVSDSARPDCVERLVVERKKRKRSDRFLLLMMEKEKRMKDLWVFSFRFHPLLHPSARSVQEQRTEEEVFEGSFRVD